MPDDSILLRCASCKTLNRASPRRLSEGPLCGQCKTPLTFPTTPVAAGEAQFDRESAEWPGFLLVEFWAKWCGYCRMIEPVVNDLASWKAGRLRILKVDVDAEPALSRRFQVRATPTFILFKNGAQLGRIDGAPKEKIELVQWLDGFMER